MAGLVYVDIRQGIHQGRNKVTQNEKKILGCLYSKIMANFLAFPQSKKQSINRLFLKSEIVIHTIFPAQIISSHIIIIGTPCLWSAHTLFMELIVGPNCRILKMMNFHGQSIHKHVSMSSLAGSFQLPQSLLELCVSCLLMLISCPQ